MQLNRIALHYNGCAFVVGRLGYSLMSAIGGKSEVARLWRDVRKVPEADILDFA
jgi:hypothetical protein